MYCLTTETLHVWLNTLWPSDTMRWQWFGSIFVQESALTDDLWNSPEGKFTESAQGICPWFDIWQSLFQHFNLISEGTISQVVVSQCVYRFNKRVYVDSLNFFHRHICCILRCWQEKWYNLIEKYRKFHMPSVATCAPHLPNELSVQLGMDMLRITVTSLWARWRLKSPASRLFTELFIRAHIKENITAPCLWPLCGDFTEDRWIPRTNGQ